MVPVSRPHCFVGLVRGWDRVNERAVLVKVQPVQWEGTWEERRAGPFMGGRARPASNCSMAISGVSFVCNPHFFPSQICFPLKKKCVLLFPFLHEPCLAQLSEQSCICSCLRHPLIQTKEARGRRHVGPPLFLPPLACPHALLSPRMENLASDCPCDWKKQGQFIKAEQLSAFGGLLRRCGLGRV